MRKGFLQRQPVDHGAQHAHVVGGRLIHLASGGKSRAADDVATTHHHCQLHGAGLAVRVGDLVRKETKLLGINAQFSGLREALAAHFQHHSFEALGHASSSLIVAHTRRGWRMVDARPPSRRQGNAGGPQPLRPTMRPWPHRRPILPPVSQWMLRRVRVARVLGRWDCVGCSWG